MTAFFTRMPKGIPGALSRPTAVPVVEAQPLNSAAAFPSYGVPGKISAGKFVPIAAANDQVYGFLYRPYPTTGANASDPLGTSVPATSGIANILRKGYMTVVCNAGAPALLGAVYVRVANPSGAKVVGGVEAAAEYGAAAANANAGNTGNGTFGAITSVAPAVAGNYEVIFRAATKFDFYSPSGAYLGSGSTGVAFAAGGVGFTITAGGTAFVVGDGFSVAVIGNTVQVPDAQFMDSADANGNVEISYGGPNL